MTWFRRIVERVAPSASPAAKKRDVEFWNYVQAVKGLHAELNRELSRRQQQRIDALKREADIVARHHQNGLPTNGW